jgi:hypothetical protein
MQERHLAVKPKREGERPLQKLETASEMSALPTKAGMFSRGIDVG